MHKELACSEVWGGTCGFQVDGTFALPGLQGAIYARSAHGDVGGGDVYSMSVCDSGMLSRVILADVAGHGIRVAQVSRRLHHLLRENMNEPDNDKFLSQLNEQFVVKEDSDTRFATLALISFFTENRQLQFSYAGHPQVLHHRCGTWKSSNVPASAASAIGNLPIGIDARAQFSQGAEVLEGGDFLLIFTDGVIEALSPDGRRYELTNLLADLASLRLTSPADVKNQLLGCLKNFTGGTLDHDDVSFIVLQAGT